MVVKAGAERREYPLVGNELSGSTHLLLRLVLRTAAGFGLSVPIQLLTHFPSRFSAPESRFTV
jgi:hypothetical protein